MKRKTLWISIIGILLIGFVCLFCYQHYIRQKQIEQKKHTGLVSEDFPVQDIKHQSKNIYEDAYQTEADNQLQNMKMYEKAACMGACGVGEGEET